MDIRWHGHSFFSLVTRTGTSILIDPFVENPLTQRRVQDFEPDVVLLTHAHQDHVGSALSFDAPIVATPELVRRLAAKGATKVVGMNVGGTWRHDDVSVWMAPAVHSSGFHPEAGHSSYGGVATGFVVDDGETRFYHAGDTGIFGDMRTVIRDLMQPHVAALPIGDHYTMGVAHAARAVAWLGVNVAIPMHYGTFPEIEADPADFARSVGAAADVVIPPADGGLRMAGPRVERLLPP